MVICQKELTLVAIGKIWLESVPLLQLLCVSGAFMPLYALYQNLVISKGRSDIYLWCNVVQILAQIALVLVFGRQGIQCMVEAYVVFNIFYLLVWHWQSQHVLELPLIEILKDIMPFIIISIAVMAITYIFTYMITYPWLMLLARIAIASALYFITMKILRVKILEECLSYMLKKKH